MASCSLRSLTSCLRSRTTVRSALMSKPFDLGFAVDVANIVGDRLLLFFKPFDPLDERLELILGEAVGGGLFVSNGGIGHRALLTMKRKFRQRRTGFR